MNITDAAKRKRQELVAAEWENNPDITNPVNAMPDAFDRYIQQTSDVAKEWRATHPKPVPNQVAAIDLVRRMKAEEAIDNLILPDEPDPRKREAMLEARKECGLIGHEVSGELAQAYEKALAKRGLKIVEATDDFGA